MSGWGGRRVVELRAEFEPLVNSGTVRCGLCGDPIRPGQRWDLDHIVPVMVDASLEFDPTNLRPAHASCNRARGARMGNATRHRRSRRHVSSSSAESFSGGDERKARPFPPLSPPSQTGMVGNPFDVSGGGLESWPDWFPTPRDDQVLPRVMTPPHPRAVGSYGPEILAWARDRFGMHPKRTEAHRWWQELVLCMAHQHDDAGNLLPSTVLLGTARQCGKSWTLREAAMWRIEQGDRWGELQTVIHAAAKLSQAEAVWKPAALWAARLPRARPARVSAQVALWDDPPPAGQLLGGYEVRRANGSAALCRLDGSAWMPQAANDQLGVSLSVSLAIVDEAWDVPRWVVDNGLVPTQAEASNAQLWIVSTAGQPKTGEVSDLYPTYRATALEDPDSMLILEWSADPDADPGDPHTWRQASPHWDERRAALLEREWRKAQAAGPKALAAFRLQWLNVWPSMLEASRWLPARVTRAATVEVGDAPSHAVVAIETAYSDPAHHAVAMAWAQGDRVIARVWLAGNLPDALALAGDRQLWTHTAVAETIGPRRWGVQPVTVAQARGATSTLRQVARTGRLSVAGVPDEQWAAVVTSTADGGELIDARRSTADVHGVKALSWAVWAVESGRSHTGFLFGAPPDAAQPGALTA